MKESDISLLFGETLKKMNISVKTYIDDINKNIWTKEIKQIRPHLNNEQVYSDNVMDAYIYHRNDAPYDNGQYKRYVYCEASFMWEKQNVCVSFLTFFEDMRTGEYFIGKRGYFALNNETNLKNIHIFKFIALNFSKSINPDAEKYYVNDIHYISVNDFEWKKQSYLLKTDVCVDINIPSLEKEIEIKIIGDMVCNISISDINNTLNRDIWNEVKHTTYDGIIESHVFIRNDVDVSENYDFHIYSDASMNANFYIQSDIYSIAFITFAVNKTNGTVCVYSCGYGYGLNKKGKTIIFYEDMAYQLSHINNRNTFHYVDNQMVATKYKANWVKGHQPGAINIGNHIADVMAKTIRLEYEEKMIMEKIKASKQLCYVD